MNDFSELEKDLKKRRPAQPSPVLFERVGEALRVGRSPAAGNATSSWWRFKEATYNWWSLGFALAAAAVLILFSAVSMERRHEHQQIVAQSSPASETRPTPLGPERSASRSRFGTAGGADVVFHTCA